MAKLADKHEDERATKGNSSDTLLAIYILRILKNYSSPKQPLNAQQVLDHLMEEHYIGPNENPDAQKKKIRRYLDTLHESYGKGCIAKIEGKTRKEGNYWYYDISRDKFANEEHQSYETLTNEEIEFIIDIIASSKIINTQSTYDIIKKLLRKTDLSKEEKNKKWKAIRREVWPKSVNKEFVELRDHLQSCIDYYRRIIFDYEDKSAIVATPYGWDSDADGRYVLIAQIEGSSDFSAFLLDKIQNLQEGDINCDPDEDAYYERNDREPKDDISLESLFINIRKINAAIKDYHGIEFKYLSYVIKNNRVIFDEENRRVLPHSLVFTDGKYYLIGFDEAKETIDYYRVDLISQLDYSTTKIKISDWNSRKLETAERAREVEKHPLMLAGNDYPITFKVVESALDRVIDAFGKRPDELPVTRETRVVRDTSGDGYHEEKIVSVQVRTTVEEAFRWALANAAAVEVTSQDVRDKIARIAEPIYQLYTQTLPDKVRENLDYISNKGIFRIAHSVDEDTAYATFKELVNRKNIGLVSDIFVRMESGEPSPYLGELTETKSLRLDFVPECEDASWASKLINVESVEISDTQIEDVSWLKEMRQLRHLRISDSPVSTLSMLNEHTGITNLHLRNTNVWDISFIENFGSLDWISLIGCPIKDYSPLLRIPGYLKSLDIDEQTAKKIDIEKIRERHIGITIAIHNDETFWYATE